MKIFKRLIFAILVVCSLSVAIGKRLNVYGNWIYYLNTSPREKLLPSTLGEFGYAPEEVVPGGEHEATLGENHLILIDLVLNENDKGYGLNINSNVLIHQYLKNNKVIYSNQKISGGNLKFILDAQNNTHGLYYCIEKVSATEYYCYTFSVTDLEKYTDTQTEIVAYRTTLLKTDSWQATLSYIGYAKTIPLSSKGISADPKCLDHSIDVNTWHV